MVIGVSSDLKLLMSVLGGGSVVVDSLLIVTPNVGLCNVVRCFMSILVLQSS